MFEHWNLPVKFLIAHGFPHSRVTAGMALKPAHYCDQEAAGRVKTIKFMNNI